MKNQAIALRAFIEKREALSRAALAKLIDWDPGSFHQWMRGERGIPDERAQDLAKALKMYGFKG